MFRQTTQNFILNCHVTQNQKGEKKQNVRKNIYELSNVKGHKPNQMSMSIACPEWEIKTLSIRLLYDMTINKSCMNQSYLPHSIWCHWVFRFHKETSKIQNKRIVFLKKLWGNVSFSQLYNLSKVCVTQTQLLSHDQTHVSSYVHIIVSRPSGVFKISQIYLENRPV